MVGSEREWLGQVAFDAWGPDMDYRLQPRWLRARYEEMAEVVAAEVRRTDAERLARLQAVARAAEEVIEWFVLGPDTKVHPGDYVDEPSYVVSTGDGEAVAAMAALVAATDALRDGDR